MATQRFFEIYPANQCLMTAALTALGNNCWSWGLTRLVFGPFAGLPYGLLYEEATYPKSLMLKGLVVILVALLLAGVVWLAT